MNITVLEDPEAGNLSAPVAFISSCLQEGLRFVDVCIDDHEVRLDLTAFTPEEAPITCNTTTPNINAAWGDAATKLLLDIYPRHLEMVKKRKILTQEKMWVAMVPYFVEQGYQYTAKQIKTKFQALERLWKKKTENSKKTGRGRIVIPFERYAKDSELNITYTYTYYHCQ